MKKSEILQSYSNPTGISYKHQQLFVGDVYIGELGTYGIVIAKKLEDGSTKHYFKKTNMCEHRLPEDRAGLNNGEFVANVVQDETLMQKFIKAGIIEDDTDNIKESETMTEAKPEEQKAEVQAPPKEEAIIPPQATKTKKTAKKAEKSTECEKAPEEEAKCLPKHGGIFAKINAVRAAWNKANIEKEGKGKAGGGAKYDYYKPQQVIDFCLKEEISNNLFSDFNIIDGIAVYSVIDMDWYEGCSTPRMVSCQCPADIPRKMAASEAQQVGAAMTYYNRRLAMMLYKIEDNSKESVDVLENADYTQAPEIPAPPIVPAAPIMTPPVPETTAPAATVPPVKTEATVPAMSNISTPEETTIPPAPESAKPDVVASENEQKEEVKKEELTPPPVQKSNPLPPPPPITEEKVEKPAVNAAPPVTETKKTGSIEDLY